MLRVASRADAWIETCFSLNKHRPGIVASRADAWIETITCMNQAIQLQSRPARTRGLKLLGVDAVVKGSLSRPARTRGLKLHRELCPGHRVVASRADAWIETVRVPRMYSMVEVASRADAWIETMDDEELTRALGRVPRGRVD